MKTIYAVYADIILLYLYIYTYKHLMRAIVNCKAWIWGAEALKQELDESCLQLLRYRFQF